MGTEAVRARHRQPAVSRPRKRSFWVWLHRWVGLLMTGFLLLVGLTGSLLAFNADLERVMAPQFYAPHREGVPVLDLGTIAIKAGPLVLHGEVSGVSFNGDQDIVFVRAATDPASGQPYELGFNQLFVDPWTGAELGRRRLGDLSQGWVNFMPFVYRLHENLALGTPGVWVLGIVALAWTLDCFYAFYLTLPLSRTRFLARWKPAWKIKWPSSPYRFNLDLHRASGLWLWPLYFVFAWSSVMFNLSGVYGGTMHMLFAYPPEPPALPVPRQARPPALGFAQAQATADRLIAEQAERHGFRVVRAVAMFLDKNAGEYLFDFESDLDLSARYPLTWLTFDATTGALRTLNRPIRAPSGVLVDSWLKALHRADILGLPYRALVCVLGLVITTLSATGVYIWHEKRRARA